MTFSRIFSPCLGFAGLALALCGCASDRPNDVPAGAAVLSEGSIRLIATAPSTGRVWITDVGNDSVVYEGQVRRGDEVTVDPDNKRVTVAGQVVTTNDVGPVDHKILFETGSPDQVTADTAEQHVQRPDAVPAAAVIASEGAKRMDYIADRAGTIWIVDSQHNVIYSGRVVQHDEFIIDPDHNILTRNGKQFSDQILDNSDRCIYFLAASESAGAM